MAEKKPAKRTPRTRKAKDSEPAAEAPVKPEPGSIEELRAAEEEIEQVNRVADKILTTTQRARLVLARQAQIVKLRVQGDKTWEQISAEVGVSPSRARALYDEWAREEKKVLVSIDPAEYVLERVASMRFLRSEGLATYQGATRVGANNWTAAIASLKLLADLHQQESELLQSVGMLPKNLGSVKVEVDTREVVEIFVSTLEKHQVGEEVLDDILDALSKALPSRVIQGIGPAPSD